MTGELKQEVKPQFLAKVFLSSLVVDVVVVNSQTIFFVSFERVTRLQVTQQREHILSGFTSHAVVQCVCAKAGKSSGSSRSPNCVSTG